VSEGQRIEIRGTVQGVGFRPWVHRLARRAGVTGRVRNDAAGVTIEVFGSRARLAAFRRLLDDAPPVAARIRELRSTAIPGEAAADFAIAPSRSGGARRASIPGDIATCEACLAELRDPRDRRHRYPFLNCTDCGPRFSIAFDVPYDRSATSMARFEMCPECRCEYTDPQDRRFHAEPNACPACGPRLAWLDASGRAQRVSDPLRIAVAALLRGQIVALKGLGGFHLACDATRTAVVARLRERKGREEKPFAVLVRDLGEARRIARVDAAAARLLTSPERPIVLLARRARPRGPAPCQAVAPGLSELGLLLPYTALHQLLAEEAGRPLVLTSGNRSDEPMACANDEACTRLRGIADGLLLHDREIASRCDDSVARVVAGAPLLLRRARGFVPRPIRLAAPLVRPVLACGAHLKNSFCLGVGESAFLGPHIGDLETPEACAAFEEAVARMERFTGIVPEVIAHDLHPEYFSTRYAVARRAVCTVGVQHHHAHAASVAAERGITGRALALVWDGTGHGSDGGAWGGELLALEGGGAFERLASFRPLRLAGGDRAVREVWRLALALLEDAFDGAPPAALLERFTGIPEARLAGVRELLARGLHAPPSHGVGRLFDAVGSLVLGRRTASYEGQVAMEWNQAAGADAPAPYPYELGVQGGLLQLDWRPMVRALSADLARGAAPAAISARFHETLAAAGAELVRGELRRGGRRPLLLAGGCFQNARLVESLLARLAGSCEVALPREVPPGDGGLALGQLAVADARTRQAEGGASCA
jgi:hydrogenase maturation protein HypF